jgi:hypothetical protein
MKYIHLHTYIYIYMYIIHLIYRNIFLKIKKIKKNVFAINFTLMHYYSNKNIISDCR